MMRLSEAIRLGAALKPQAQGWVVGMDATCALGAAMDAMGLLGQGRPASPDEIGTQNERGETITAWSMVLDVPDDWKPLLWRDMACPECHIGGGNLMAVIPHLNDWHKWSRERIAEWVGLLEAMPEVPATAPEAVTEDQ